MEIKFSGLDKLQKEIKRKSEVLSGNVELSELLDDSFMQKFTNHMTFDAFFSKCGINSAEDFKNFPEEKLDHFVSENSKFSTWNEMKTKAAEMYIAKKWNDA